MIADSQHFPVSIIAQSEVVDGLGRNHGQVIVSLLSDSPFLLHRLPLCWLWMYFEDDSDDDDDILDVEDDEDDVDDTDGDNGDDDDAAAADDDDYVDDDDDEDDVDAAAGDTDG